jgi:hypothetical protein
MPLALRPRKRWPSILLNETHPKVLIPALGGKRRAEASPEVAMAWFASHARLDVSGVRGGHPLDCPALGLGHTGGAGSWRASLAGDDPALLFPAGRASYLCPKATTRKQEA